MNSRERILRAIARKEPDRVPIYLHLTPAIADAVRKEHGVEDVEDFLKMDLRFVNYTAQPESNDFSAYTRAFHPGTRLNAWGCGTYPVGYYHFTKDENPMRDFTSVEEVEKYPFPRREGIVEAIRKGVQAVQARGLAAVSAYECGTFEQAFGLMGMENLLANLHINPDMVERLFDRISDIKARIAAAQVEAGVDILFIGDDIGIQSGPVMDPAMWRKYLLPPLKKIIRRARSIRPDVPVAYHSCGAVEFACEGLVEAGVTILQSVQPEANDCARLKAEFGSRLAFWGGMGSQSTFSHGTPQDIRAQVKYLMETLGKGGGLICGPAHYVEPESPLANITAFMEAIEEFGHY